MERIEAKTKSGKTVGVLVLSAADLVEQGPERQGYEAARLATEQGCAHWRIVSVSGAVVQHGKASAPHMTREQAAAVSGPANERHDW